MGSQLQRASSGDEPPCRMRRNDAQGLPPELVRNSDSTAEHVKTAIDEDKISFALFGLSVVGSICCWSGCLVMPEWIYWGDKIHGLSFEISGPIFSLWAGTIYIRGTGARDRFMMTTAERVAGAAITLQLACWYLVNLRTLKVRIDVNDLSSEYTEEAYTYYVIGCVLNLIAMGGTLHCIYNRNLLLKTGTDDIKALDKEWEARQKLKEKQDAERRQQEEAMQKSAPKAAVHDVEAAHEIPPDDVLGDDDDFLEPASL